MRLLIRLHHANFPVTRKLPPHFAGNFGSDAPPAATTNNKEFGDIPDCGVTGNFRALLYEHKASWFAIQLDQKRVPVRLAPIERKVLVAESTVDAELYVVEFAEIVSIQFEQVCECGLVFRRREATQCAAMFAQVVVACV